MSFQEIRGVRKSQRDLSHRSSDSNLVMWAKKVETGCSNLSVYIINGRFFFIFFAQTRDGTPDKKMTSEIIFAILISERFLKLMKQTVITI
jgi:hypothetical protein